MGDPKISVVINTYNQKRFIGKAIRGVLAQTYRPWEIIVMDDGSSDGSQAFVESEFGDAVKYHLQANRGIGNSRNSSIRLCTGDWIAFLDCDDHWMPRKLELQVAEIRSNPKVAMVACGWVESTPDDQILSEVGLPRPFRMDTIRAELRRRGIFTPSAALIRRDVLIEVEGFPEDLVFCEDWVTFSRIAALYDIAGVDQPLFHKTQLPESLSSQPDAVLRDGLESLRRCQVALTSRKWPQRWFDGVAFRQSATQLFLHAAGIYGRRGDKGKAVAVLLKGLLRWPLLTVRQYRTMYWLCSDLLRRG
jgi:glycosyltransferase involved in cell wall biosynthesis